MPEASVAASEREVVVADASLGGRDACTALSAATDRWLLDIFERECRFLDESPSTVSAADVAEFVESVAHYSAPRFNALVGILRRIVPHQAREVRRRKVHPKHVDLPEQGQFAALLRELDAAPQSHAGLIVRFLALTGLRIGEARRITWRDVRAEGIYVAPGKNHRPRIVPLIGELPAIVERLRAVSAGSANVLPAANVKTALRRACDRAGMSRLSHHDFRRLFATRCIECGVDVPTAARWLGHQDGGALLSRTYFHLRDGHSREMARRVEIAA
jgi:integrase